MILYGRFEKNKDLETKNAANSIKYEFVIHQTKLISGLTHQNNKQHHSFQGSVMVKNS